MLGGVAAALAEQRGIDPTLVRVGLVLFGLISGVGVALYVVAWLVLPAEGDDPTIAARALGDARGLALAVAVIPVGLLALAATSAADSHLPGIVGWPAVVSAAGLVLIWRNGSPDDQAILRRISRPVLSSGSRSAWRGLVIRVLAGLVLAGGGAVALTLADGSAVLVPMAGVALVLGAVVVIFGPWWLNLGRDLVLERQARLRAEERADLASRVHDSVLQTLAMIQRSADDPQRVAQLARAQERELRSWLFEGRPPGSFADDVTTVADAVRRIQSEVEADHGVAVDVVVVGDGPLTDETTAVLAAGREAAVNAARWSGAPVVSIFAEVEPGRMSLFVRDRGSGFDRDAVDPERKGVAESIEGRMARAGGHAVVRTAPGQGTEVELTVERHDRVHR